jgi:hypothetical protein
MPRTEGEWAVKYILTMNGTKSDFDSYAMWSKQDLEANVTFMRTFSKELKDTGVFVDTKGLAWPQEAKMVRARADGEPVTDGVFPESKEFLAGYWIVDVETPEQAYKIAARAAAAPGPGGKSGNMPIEVRQVLSSHSDLGL